ncbi:hypothetical protein [Aureimonas altamirensis]|uniref:hypothetical protein n=1 Tax=Aureimonas altamirensis TaxID=370622 RepID=UPI002553FF18|nr:hypothetical protein [Aureimonas altamirensis]
MKITAKGYRRVMVDPHTVVDAKIGVGDVLCTGKGSAEFSFTTEHLRLGGQFKMNVAFKAAEIDALAAAATPQQLRLRIQRLQARLEQKEAVAGK